MTAVFSPGIRPFHFSFLYKKFSKSRLEYYISDNTQDIIYHVSDLNTLIAFKQHIS